MFAPGRRYTHDTNPVPAIVFHPCFFNSGSTTRQRSASVNPDTFTDERFDFVVERVGVGTNDDGLVGTLFAGVPLYIATPSVWRFAKKTECVGRGMEMDVCEKGARTTSFHTEAARASHLPPSIRMSINSRNRTMG